jgi:predicted dehydrogenase
MDLGCYCVSGARFVAGAEPERVHGEQVVGGDGVDVAFAGTLRFGGGVLAQFDCSFASARRHDLEVVGDQGVLRLPDPWHGHNPGIDLVRDGKAEHIAPAPVDAYAAELEDFARTVAGFPAKWGRDDALAQAAVIEALYASAEEGEET